MTTDKLSVQALVEICFKQGIRRVIFSPGSRNAPLVIGFSEHGGFDTLVIADERVAAFHALGQAIATMVPSIICCTSGTAALNYGPAIAEAYYQKVPMLILTADRPVEWIDMGIGQSMRQNGVFDNYVKESFQFVQEASDPDDLWYNERLANQAIILTTSDVPGPVHINLPFRESLYRQVEKTNTRHPIVQILSPQQEISEALVSEILDVWNSTSKRLIIVGQGQYSKELNNVIEELTRSKGVVVMTETTSNIKAKDTIGCIDRVLPLVGEQEHYKPDLVISLGGAIVSKRIKSYIKSARPEYHWVLGLDKPKDTYQRLSHHFKMHPITVLKLLSQQKITEKKFAGDWGRVDEMANKLHKQFLKEIGFCDLKVFEVLLSQVPRSFILHFASSTPIRYSQLFSELQRGIRVQCNRGVSGIDGSTCTALGYAGCTDTMNILITGDISFFYDSNAFWYTNRPTNLKVILINNGGGNIFKYIPGPETTKQLEVFEAAHQLDAAPLATLYDLDYSKVSSLDQLSSVLPKFYKEDSERIAILEIDTRASHNSDTLRDYFNFLSANVLS